MSDLQQIKGAALEEVVRQMPAAAFVIEAPSGKIVLVNEQARQTVEQGLGRPMPSGLAYFQDLQDSGDFEMLRPDGQPYEPEEWPLMRSIRSGEEVRDEIAGFLVGGTRIPVRCNSSPVYDDEGRLVAGIIVFHDITEEKRAEESQARYAAILEASTDFVATTDTDGRVLSLNRAGRRMVGIGDDEDVSSTRISDYYPEWAREMVLEAGIPAAIHEGAWSGETALLGRDGQKTPVSQVIIAHEGPSGEVEYLSTIARDLSERQRLETEQRRLAAVTETSPDFIGIADLDFWAIYVNEAGQSLVGLNGIEEVRRTRVWDYFPPEDQDRVRYEILPEVMEKGSWSGEINFQHFETGEKIPVIWDQFRIDDPRTGQPINVATVTRDITERKQAEEALRYQLGLTETITEKAADPMFMMDAEGRTTFANPAAEQTFGYSRDELVGEVLHDKIHHHYPDGRPYPRSECSLGQALASIRTLRDYEEVFVRKDGSMVDVSCSRAPLVVNGKVNGAVMVVRDIGDRKRAERELRESKRRNEEILESITDGFYAMDRHWRFTYLNARAVRFASQLAGEEFTHEGLLGRTLWETLPATVGTTIEERYRRAVREQQTAVFEYPYPRGDPIFEVYAYPSEQGLSIYFRDITERKLAEKEIETRARQQAVVAELGLWALANRDLQSFMDDAVTLVAQTLDVEYGKIVELLPGDEELLMRWGVGWKEGLVGEATEGAGSGSQAGYTLRSERPVVVEDLRAETRFSPSPLLREHGAVSGMSVVIPGRGGSFGAIGMYTGNHRIFSEDDVHFLQAVANVLAMRVEREEADKKLHEIREAERSRIARDLHDEALRDLSHAVAEARLVQETSKEPEPADRLGRLVAALERVAPQLRSAIYDLSLEGEREKPFSELLESLVGLHREMVPDLDIRLDLSDGMLSGPLGKTSRELLRIIGEALTNARRHSEASSVLVSVRTSEDEKLLWAEVSDDGWGFDPAEEPSATATGGMGTRGMYERARALGGDLKIESAPEKGTKVRFELSLMTEREEPEGEEVRLLLVEDHAAFREAIASTFEREVGFVVAGQASSLVEARQMLVEEVDVAVVDLGLPDGYGGDLIKELREANPQAQTLVLSASLDRAEIARAVESGAAGVLHKTARLDEVVEAVERLRSGETLLPLEEIVELLRFAGSRREQEYEARQAIERLTPREREVLQALAEGLDSEGIAERLHISLRTQRNHMANILAKLGVHSQLQALVFALRHGVVEIS